MFTHAICVRGSPEQCRRLADISHSRSRLFATRMVEHYFKMPPTNNVSKTFRCDSVISAKLPETCQSRSVPSQLLTRTAGWPRHVVAARFNCASATSMLPKTSTLRPCVAIILDTPWEGLLPAILHSDGDRGTWEKTKGSTVAGGFGVV
jgi:hypothetical protein